jgi:hypothetical protein
MDFLFRYFNHHHTGSDCKCIAQVETQFQEVQTCKIKLTKKCEEIQVQLLKDLDLFNQA